MSTRPAHLGAIVKMLQQARPGGETEIADVFRTLVPKIHRRSMLIILSDCFGDVSALMKSLAHFRHHKHDIVLMQIWDRDELEFPFHQRSRFESLENPEDFQMIDPSHLRSAYLKNLERFREELRQGCYRHRIDLVPMVTDQPYAEALGQYLALRKRLATA